MDWASTHPDGPKPTNLAGHGICRTARGLFGRIGCLLLFALAGCQVAAPVPDLASMFAAGQVEADAVVSRMQPSSEDLAPAAAVGSEVSNTLPAPEPVHTVEPGQPPEPEQPAEPASLVSELPAEPMGPLSLEAAIALALERNPDLAAVRAGEPVAQAAFQVAATYPWNPQFQTQVAPYNRDRDGNDGSTAQQHVLVQTFELGGQRCFRKGAAAADWEQVRSTIRHAELINAAQTTRLYFAVLYQRELNDMNRSLADLNEQLVGVTQRREAAGQANRADVELARLQAQAARRQQRLAEANYQTAMMDLRNQLNLDANIPLQPAGQWLRWRWWSLDEVLGGSPEPMSAGSFGGGPQEDPGESTTSIPPVDDVTLRQLVAERPDVGAARAAAAAAAENLRLAQAMRRPNLQLGPVWQRDEAATEFWGVQAQIDIPVVDTGKPLVAQRAAELRQQQIAAAQLENRAVLEARAAVLRYERARRLVEESRGGFASTIPEALTPFERQFQAGQISLLEVLAARTALVQSRQSFLDLLNELALAAADVTQTTGLPPQLLVADAEPQAEQLEEVPRP